MSVAKSRYILDRLRGLLRPPLTVRPAPESEVVFERDVEVTVRDGTVLRVNVFRPRGAGAHPAILCAHPYGKDNLPAPKRGPMALRLRVSLDGAADTCLFAGVEKWRRGRFVPFEGSYWFGLDRVSTGWAKLSHRQPDPQLSRAYAPVSRDDVSLPLAEGEEATLDFALGPSATFFRAGEELRLVLAGRWLSPRNPLTGQFPAAYEHGPDCTVRRHCGADPPPRLLVPRIPHP